MKAVFLDRDGTINAGIPLYERVDSVKKLELLPTVMQALKKLSSLDYLVFIVTNQAGIAEGLITESDFETINNTLIRMIAPSGIKITKTYHCPHEQNYSICECQKPKPTMILKAAQEYGIDLHNSWTVGDRLTDVMTGINAGTKTILVKSGALKDDSEKADYTATTLLDAVDYIEHQDNVLDRS
jgi:histidinol-phosphate phosphatase family protein